MAEDDIGSSYLKGHMSESGPSRAMGGFGNKTRIRAPRGTDSELQQRYGKEVDLSPVVPQSVNRGRKGNKF